MKSTAPRVVLIHALAHSMAPVNAAFERDWPQCQRMNLLDDSLSADLARGGQGLDARMHDRFEQLAAYAVGCGAQGLLFTCSAFGPCIEAVARRRPDMPVLKPNEAMVAEALRRLAPGQRLGLVASFEPTLQSMPAEFGAGIDVRTCLAADALAALNAGDGAAHDAAVCAAARSLQAQGCAVIALAQFSMARAAPAVRQALGAGGPPVLTTVDSAVVALRERLATSTR
ncbi:aspartate/glutamate racemase family protein [Methylibium sp.]|uniref:aspartate/glutamate racemase family protein n=1 Tax=Methylibium sp. TaxID=2067992 RepID=UPI0017E35680|nr:aspartate/glutamate racemase family protein [Methylibium sp.]MBA3588632.1 arylsulfatase [Methylibium sp.]